MDQLPFEVKLFILEFYRLPLNRILYQVIDTVNHPECLVLNLNSSKLIKLMYGHCSTNQSRSIQLLYKHIDLSYPCIVTNVFPGSHLEFELLEKLNFNNLKSVLLRGQTDLTLSDVIDFIDRCPRLDSIDLKNQQNMVSDSDELKYETKFVHQQTTRSWVNISCYQYRTEAIDSLSSFPQLQVLQIINPYNNRKAKNRRNASIMIKSNIVDDLLKLSNIKKLYLLDYTVTRDNLAAIQQSKCLQALHVDVPYAFLRRFLKICSRHPSLKKLYLGRHDYEDDDFRMLSSTSSLCNLALSSSTLDLSAQGFDFVLSNHFITKLSLTDMSKISSELFTALGASKYLTKLTISYSKVTDGDLELLFGVPGGLPFLQHLNVDGNESLSNSSMIIAMKHKSLTSVQMKGASLSADWLLALDGMQSDIKKLCFGCIRISSEITNEHARILSGMRSMEHLEIWGFSVSPEIMADLVDACQSLNTLKCSGCVSNPDFWKRVVEKTKIIKIL
ncbi:tRNA dimethylallyltransferase [Acrasis kona]|uniref:tRNA dimethylallyltransferase n=1 Tax=Acrasis kona TaxID=1008807 RepID=A0AAW2ZI23_9EUKA